MRVVALGLAFLAAAVAATWPVALHLTSSVPLGTEHESTIPLFSLWNLWWTADRIPHGFDGFWDAPFFYPNHGVTAFSEPMPLAGVLTAPLWVVSAPPALIYNIALLGLLALNGVFAYRLARALATPAEFAAVAGVAAVMLPFLANIAGVLPAVGVFGVFWALEGLVRFGESGSARWAAWAAGGVLATFLTYQQYALLAAPIFALAGAIALAERRFAREALLRLGASGLVTAVLVVLLAKVPIEIRDEFALERPESTVEALSAHPGDFFSRPANALLGFPGREPADTAGLFPGILLLGLATIGLVAGLRNPERRSWTAFLGASCGVFVLLALGLNLDIAGWRPFATLRSAVPGLEGMRSPYRAAALFQACAVPLAAIGLARLGALGIRRAAVLAVTVGLLAAAENASSGADLLRVPAKVATGWTAWIRTEAPNAAIAHVPFPDGLHVSDYAIEARRLFHQIDHGRPLVNGYSGYFPQTPGPDGRTIPTYTLFQLAMAKEFPSYRTICVLGLSLKANVLVIDRSWLTEHARKLRRFRRFLRVAHEDAEASVYRLGIPPDECQTG